MIYNETATFVVKFKFNPKFKFYLLRMLPTDNDYLLKNKWYEEYQILTTNKFAFLSFSLDKHQIRMKEWKK